MAGQMQPGAGAFQSDVAPWASIIIFMYALPFISILDHHYRLAIQPFDGEQLKKSIWVSICTCIYMYIQIVYSSA